MYSILLKNIKINTVLFIISLLLIPDFVYAKPLFRGITVTPENNEVGLYNKFEIDIDLSATFKNPYDYDDINLVCKFVSPSGETKFVDGFYYKVNEMYANGKIVETGKSCWKVRFSPTETGTWYYHLLCINKAGSGTYPVKSFTCVDSDNPGFLRTNEGYYLGFDNGRKIFLKGINERGAEGEETLRDVFSRIDKFTLAGGNLIRVWMASWTYAIEWTDTELGNYDNRQKQAFELDLLLDYTLHKGIYVQLCLNNHGQVSTKVNPEWNYSPYNQKNGGPCKDTIDFFRDQKAKKFYKRRIRYIISRWGYASNLIWELFNELDWTDNFTDSRDDVKEWVMEMSRDMKSLDVNSHLITTSFGWNFFDPEVWRLDTIDLTQLHYYSASDDLVVKLVSGIKSYSEYGKPVMVGEYGLEGDAGENIRLDPHGIHLHNTFWGLALSGAFGTGMPWSWHYIEKQNLYDTLTGVSTFMASEDFTLEDYSPVNVDCHSDATYSDIVLVPGYWVFKKAIKNNFYIKSSGIVSPSESKLQQFIFGTRKTEFKNPPMFCVNFQKAGKFQVDVKEVSSTSSLRIRVDGTTQLEIPAKARSSYSIDIPIGKHIICVDVQGDESDWIRVSKYIFRNYASPLKSLALKNNAMNRIIGWVQNNKYNWQYVRKNGTPPPITDGSMFIDRIVNGDYQIEWWNCKTGTIESKSDVTVKNGTLKIKLPDIKWDYGYKIYKEKKSWFNIF